MQNPTLKSKRIPKTNLLLISLLIAGFLGMLFLVGFDFYGQNLKRTAPSPKPNVNTQIETNKDTAPAIYEWKLEIPKITVSVPVVPSVDGASKATYNEALKGGVAHFKSTGVPGGKGNIFIFGHSSSILGTGKYDKVFARLGELAFGDAINILFNGVNYQYKVSEKRIVGANDTSVLSQTKSEVLTLMTCWPIASDQKRLVVIANRF